MPLLSGNIGVIPGVDKPSTRYACSAWLFNHRMCTVSGIPTIVACLWLRHGHPPFYSGLNEDVEKEACFILGLLAVKPEYQSRIASCGALEGLVRLLQQHNLSSTTKAVPGSGGAARRAADAITNLAHENSEIKNMVREQGGIPPLVLLLEAMDLKV